MIDLIFPNNDKIELDVIRCQNFCKKGHSLVHVINTHLVFIMCHLKLNEYRAAHLASTPSSSSAV